MNQVLRPVAGTMELTGKVSHVIWTKPEDSFYIFALKVQDGQEVKATGKSPVPLRKGMRLKLDGYYQTGKYGRQFSCVAIQEEKPADEAGLVSFLKARIDSIGDVMAQRLVQTFGQDLPRILTEEPARLLTVAGMTLIKLERIKESWKAAESDREIMILLTKLGLSVNLAQRVKTELGSDTVKKVSDNPYILMEVEGIGIIQADSIFFRLGGVESDPKRIGGFILAVLWEAVFSVGHVYLKKEELYNWIQFLIKKNALLPIMGISPEKVMEVLQQIKDSAKLMVEDERVYLLSLYYAERNTAELLAFRRFKTVLPPEFPLSEFIASQEADSKISFSEEQRRFLSGFFDHSVHILTGLPGTGKTTVLKALVSMLEATKLSYALCAPTGMAAKKLAQMTGRHTFTLHRYLGATGSGVWLYNSDNLRQESVVIVDEMSMVDILLLYHLLDGTSNTTRFVFVGDTEQLPSVGPGNVLDELIQSGKFNVVRLSRIYRQQEESLIVENAHRVSRGEELVYDKARGFAMAQAQDSRFDQLLSAVQDKILELKVPSSMILAPKHKGTHGVVRINRCLQEKLNPPDPSKEEVVLKDYPLRTGDKVVICRNNYNKGVVNGDQGVISSIDKDSKKLYITVEDVGEVEYGFNELTELKLAYCLSVHKSQGSQAEWVVVVVQPEHRILLSRRLFYTAITRAQKRVIILGDQASIAYAIANTRISQRNSHLAVLLGQFCQDEA